MAFDARTITMVGLAKIELPIKTLLLCDGGTVRWGSDRYVSSDADFGTIDSIEAVQDQVGNESPGGRLTLLPPAITSSVALASPAAQGAAMRFWLAEADQSTGAIIGTPELLFSGVLESITLSLDRGKRTLEVDFASEAERLFSVAEGNVFSPQWHKSIWSGETGLDHATGAGVAVAWGVASPGRSGGLSFFFGGGGAFGNAVN